jgi:hypothetical protein
VVDRSGGELEIRIGSIRSHGAPQAPSSRNAGSRLVVQRVDSSRNGRRRRRSALSAEVEIWNIGSPFGSSARAALF